MYSDVEDLYFQLKREVDYAYAVIASCERSNDRDGILYHSGKLHAYSNVVDCLKDLLADADIGYYLKK